jgi:hypothetical protein
MADAGSVVDGWALFNESSEFETFTVATEGTRSIERTGFVNGMDGWGEGVAVMSKIWERFCVR